MLDPPFWILKIRCQIRNQRPQKPWSTKFHENSKLLCLPFRIPKIRCEIHNQPPRKLLSTEFCGNCVVFQNYMSDVLDILFEIGEKFFLAVQLFRSPLIIVPILFWLEKKLWKKNSRFFGTFLQIWRHIGFPTRPNSILTTDSWRAHPKL